MVCLANALYLSKQVPVVLQRATTVDPLGIIGVRTHHQGRIRLFPFLRNAAIGAIGVSRRQVSEEEEVVASVQTVHPFDRRRKIALKALVILDVSAGVESGGGTTGIGSDKLASYLS